MGRATGIGRIGHFDILWPRQSDPKWPDGVPVEQALSPLRAGNFFAILSSLSALVLFPCPLFWLVGINNQMTMRTSMNEWQLLQAYAKNRSEAAFAELVRL